MFILPGKEEDSILDAVFTVSPQISYTYFFKPTIPAMTGPESVSYTHLDVYKRQVFTLQLSIAGGRGARYFYDIANTYSTAIAYNWLPFGAGRNVLSFHLFLF